MNTVKKLKKTHVGVELIRLITAEGNRIFPIIQALKLAHKAGIRDSYLL
ncbi:MAG: hypothetical protein ACMUIU_07140 [bacterium]